MLPKNQKTTDTAFTDALKYSSDTVNNRASKQSDINFAIYALLDKTITPAQETAVKDSFNEWNLKPAAIKTYYKNHGCIKRFGGIPNDTTELVDMWVKKNKLKVDLQNNITTRAEFDGPRTEGDEVLHQMCSKTKNLDTAYYRFIVDAADYTTVYKTNVARSAWESKIAFLRAESEAKIYSSVKFDPSKKNAGEAELGKLIYAFLDTKETAADVATAAIRSFMWMVKRKLIGASVSDHSMIVFVGEQGCGKTTFISKLIRQLEGGTALVNFNQLQDDRYNAIFNLPILFVDEMSYLKTADSGMLKSLLTSETTTNRALYSNSVNSHVQGSTFIGAANTSIAQLFYDPTGMRRFIEIYCLSKSKANWNAINQIDFRLIWQAVDESQVVNPINLVREKLDVIQEQMRQKSPTEQWLVYYLCSNPLQYNEVYTSADFFHENAEAYLNRNHPKHGLNVRTFGNQLADLLRKDAFSGAIEKLKQRAKRGVQYRLVEQGVQRFRKEAGYEGATTKVEQALSAIRGDAA